MNPYQRACVTAWLMSIERYANGLRISNAAIEFRGAVDDVERLTVESFLVLGAPA